MSTAPYEPVQASQGELAASPGSRSACPDAMAVVVGGGHAGGELCTSLREQGWQGHIVLLTDEEHLPYHRPPLSKTFLQGEDAPESLLLRPPGAYDKARVEVLRCTRVERLVPGARTLTLSGGRELRYDKLALATGGRPRRLPSAMVGEADPENLHYLRTADDGLRLRAQFTPGAQLVVVGGGYVGLEVAASAIALGLRVTVLEAAPRLLARVTSPQISAFYEAAHRDAGAVVHTSAQVSELAFAAGGRRVTEVVCSDTSRHEADLVVVGIGQLPNTELAEAAGLMVDDGIVVDALARTSDPDIVAAGDCTRHWSPMMGRTLRLESVPNAMEQARTAAASMCGRERPHHLLPWFWSDQYDLKLKSVGLPHDGAEVILRGSMRERRFSLFYLQDGRVVAADTVNRPQDFMLSKRLVADRIAVDVARLADDGAPLNDLLPAR